MKYIIDVPDDAKWIEVYHPVDHLQYESNAIFIERLEPYTEPDRKAIEDEVWEFVKSCIDMDGIDFYRCFEDGSIYCLTGYTYSEAKAKYDDWKAENKKISVGDEVVNNMGRAYVIYHIDRDKQLAYGVDFTVGYPLLLATFPMHGHYIPNKTGKHFPEVAELLKKIRGEEK